MPSTETCSGLTSVDCYRNHICSWPKFKICTTLLYIDIRFPGNTLSHKHRLSLPLPVLSSSPSSPLSGQGLWRPRVSHKILLWARNGGELFGRVLAKDKFTKNDAITAPSLMPPTTSTTMTSSLRPEVHFPSFLSPSLPSPTWRTREHPLPFQWLQHRRLLHASPHAFPTILFIFSQK